MQNFSEYRFVHTDEFTICDLAIHISVSRIERLSLFASQPASRSLYVCRLWNMWMYVLVAFGVCFFFHSLFRSYILNLFLSVPKRQTCIKYTRNQTIQPFISFTLLSIRLSFSIACVRSISIPFGRSVGRFIRLAWHCRKRSDVHFWYCYCCPCIHIHRRAHRTF